MRTLIPLRLIALIAGTVVAAAGATSCATTTSAPSGPSTHSQSGSPPPAPSQTTSPTTSVTPASCPGGWQTGPLTVTRQVAVPPVPVATAIRAGSHPDCRFDRLVLDISGAMPGYHVGFVPTVTQDASGKTISMPGTSFLVITLKPTQGHNDSGSTLPTTVQTVSYPMLKSYAVAGDFEGVLSVALGLAGGTKYRVGELAGRIYVDVAW